MPSIIESLKALFDLLARLFSKRGASESASPVADAFPISAATMTQALTASCLGKAPDNVVLLSDTLRAGCVRYGMTEPLVVAHLLPNLAHESGSFRFTEEIWTNSPAQQRYEGNRNLGNTHPGDGRKFRGMFPIQLTGRYNQEAYCKYAGITIEQLHAEINDLWRGIDVSLWYICVHRRGFIDAARSNDFLGSCVVVNGKNKNGLPNGWEDRQRRFHPTLKALGLEP